MTEATQPLSQISTPTPESDDPVKGKPRYVLVETALIEDIKCRLRDTLQFWTDVIRPMVPTDANGLAMAFDRRLEESYKVVNGISDSKRADEVAAADQAAA